MGGMHLRFHDEKDLDLGPVPARARLEKPVFDLEASDPPELLDVRGDEGCAQAERVGADLGVQRTDRVPLFSSSARTGP